MKSIITAKKHILILAGCIVVITAMFISFIYNRNVRFQKQNEDLINSNKPITNSSEDEPDYKQDNTPATKPVNETRYLNIYTVDRGFHDIINQYAKEHWDFAYHINCYADDIVYSDKDIIEITSDKLVNDPTSLDLYCVPAYAQQYFIKGELSDYACPYKELGIEVDAGIKKSDIPQYIIENGSTLEGEIIALPYLANVSVFVYRRSVAKEVWGTDDPSVIAGMIGGGTESWDSFQQAALTLKKHGFNIVPGIKDLANTIDISSSLNSNGEINSQWLELMDIAKFLYDNGCIKDTDTWTKQWFEDLDGVGDKTFGYITFTDYYQYVSLDHTVGDWAICLSPYNTRNDHFTGVLVNKNSLNKDILGPFIEWLTLDSSETGLQYRLANGTFYEDEKVSVISGTVLQTVDSSRDYLGGQNINPILYEALNKPARQFGINDKISDLFYWEDAIRAYLWGGKNKESVIEEFKLTVSPLTLPEPEPNLDEVIVWKNQKFEAAIRNLLKKPKSEIYLSDVSQITKLEIEGNNIDDIADIVHFINLTHLYCNNNRISDISSLKELSKLKVVHLSGNKIKDIKSLENLVKLEELNLMDNEVKDISILSKLRNLEILYLRANEIEDINSLAKLTNLKILDLSENNIKNITGLQNLTRLNFLWLYGNKISDISDLKKLKSLIELQIDRNQISDISSLMDFNNLETLCMSDNDIREIKGLGSLMNLQYLILNHNKIDDISELNKLKKLRNLEITYNKLTDISNLIGLKNLEHLDLSNNEIIDINSLGEFSNLNSLFLADNQISDIGVISKLKNLKSLSLAGNDIKDKSPAKHVENVTWFHEIKPSWIP